jgi:hypothetical protein
MTGKIIRPAPAEIEYRNMRFLITDQPQVNKNALVSDVSELAVDVSEVLKLSTHPCHTDHNYTNASKIFLTFQTKQSRASLSAFKVGLDVWIVHGGTKTVLDSDRVYKK